MNKKSIIITISFLILITITLLGLTYAYYRTRVIGNKSNESISVTSKKLGIVYADNKEVLEATNVGPDEFEKTKEFTVSNTGDEAINYTIVFDKVENTFELAGWEYELNQVVGDGTRLVTTGIINRLETQTVEENITIDAGVTDTYKITFRYVDTGLDQSDDMGKSLSLRINIREASQWDSAEEGSLLYAIKTSNNVVDTVTVPGKASSGYTYYQTYEEEGGVIGELMNANPNEQIIPSFLNSVTKPTMLANEMVVHTYEISADYQKNRYYTYADSYTFDESTGTYTLIDPKYGKYVDIYNILKGKYVVSRHPKSTGSFFGDSNPMDTYENISSITQFLTTPTPSDDSSITFEYVEKNSTVKTIDEAVLSSAEDDYGVSYYYRGNVQNNYVNYSGMCWRIVRIQGNGTIKLALADENNECNSKNYTVDNTTSAFIENASTYIYKTESENNINDLLFAKSDIKNILDTWSSKEVKDSSGNIIRKVNLDNSKLAVTEWCNDMSLKTDSRIKNRYTANPSLKCDFVNSEGSTSVKYLSNIGMLTADEIAYAGSSALSTANYYLQTNATGSYWTLSPSDFYYRGVAYAYIYFINNKGGIDTLNVANTVFNVPSSLLIRPSIILKNDVTLDTSISGQDGTQENPYVIN